MGDRAGRGERGGWGPGAGTCSCAVSCWTLGSGLGSLGCQQQWLGWTALAWLCLVSPQFLFWVGVEPRFTLEKAKGSIRPQARGHRKSLPADQSPELRRRKPSVRGLPVGPPRPACGWGGLVHVCSELRGTAVQHAHTGGRRDMYSWCGPS